MTLQTPTTTASSKFPMPTKGQLAAAGRYAGAAAGTAATVGAVLGVLTPEQSAAFVADVKAVIDDMANLFGDVSKLVLLVMPIATVWLAKIGYNSASPKAQIASVQAMPQAQVVVSDPKLAEGIPGVKIGAV
jgi:ethanolamine utilization microcompartment shell protein EutL